MESSDDKPQLGLTARVLPAVYLFTVSVVSGVIIGHAAVTVFYHPTALGWIDALAIPLIIVGCIAFKAHLRALEEHTEEEYLENLRRGFSAHVIYFIAIASLIGGLVSGGLAASDRAEQHKAEEEANEAIASSKNPAKLFTKPKTAKTHSKTNSQLSTGTTGGAIASASTSAFPSLVLKSIVGAETRRTALINNIVMGEGQSSTIKADGTSYQVRCVIIETNKVTLEVAGQTNQVILTL